MADLTAEDLAEVRRAVVDICTPWRDECIGLVGDVQAAAGVWKELADAGFVGVSIGEEYGGGGGGIAGLVAVIEAAAFAGAPLLMLVVSPAICGSILQRHGTEEQRLSWLPAMAAGKAVMAFAITESDAGSNSHRITTRARWERGGWVLNGQKTFISGVEDAAAVLVVARAGDQPDAPMGLFIVPLDSPGLHAEPMRMSVRTPERQAALFLDDVHLGDDALVGGAPGGLGQVFTGLNPERIAAAALSVGVGRRALDIACTYAKTRVVWGNHPIGSHQGIAHPLARAYIRLEHAAAATREAAADYDSGGDPGLAANMAKFAAAEAAVESVDRAIQTLGGGGLSEETGLVALWSIVRLMRVAPVSEEMVLNHVAQHALGLPRSY